MTCHVVENVNFYLPDVNENKLGVFSEVNGSNWLFSLLIITCRNNVFIENEVRKVLTIWNGDLRQDKYWGFGRSNEISITSGMLVFNRMYVYTATLLRILDREKKNVTLTSTQ